MRLLNSFIIVCLIVCPKICSNQKQTKRFRSVFTTIISNTSITTNFFSSGPANGLSTETSNINATTKPSSETAVEKNVSCVPPTINDFPKDLFTQNQRKYGGLVFHIFFVCYLFIAITKLCDEYFIASLEFISKRFNLDEDVAGATFMAAGSSAPEVFISLIGVFVTEADVGIGTIVGSAVFNILFVIGICALFVDASSRLSIWPFFRDSVFYTISIIVLIIFISDNRVYWYESLIMLIMYAFYILFMSKNAQIKKKCCEKLKLLQYETEKIIPNHKTTNENLFSSNSKPNAEAGYSRFDDEDLYAWGGTVDSFTGLQNSYQNSYNLSRLEIVEQNYHDAIKAADEHIARRTHQIDFETAVLAVMVARRHFGVKTRFKMAIRLVINEVYNLYMMDNNHDKHTLYTKLGYFDGIGLFDLAKCIFYAPINTLFYFSIPDCKIERFEKWYIITFCMSILWLAITSYFMVWMVTIIGFTFGIPDSIMGITFLAAGTSIPDAYSSVVVVRQGYVDMGVSNIFGSNVFDLLIGLAVPWFIKSIFSTGYIRINSNGLVYDSIMLFSCVAFTIIAIHFRKWYLDRRIGYIFLSVYAAFIIFSSAIELNLFAFVNPPVCKV